MARPWAGADPRDLARRISLRAPKTKAELGILRNDAPQMISVTLGVAATDAEGRTPIGERLRGLHHKPINQLEEPASTELHELGRGTWQHGELRNLVTVRVRLSAALETPTYFVAGPKER
jgi:hypothetical protein